MFEFKQSISFNDNYNIFYSSNNEIKLVWATKLQCIIIKTWTS